MSIGSGPIHLSQFMRGYGAWLGDLLLRPAFATGLLDRITEIFAELIHRALQEAGDYVDVVCYSDDLGTQRAPLISPELYRQTIKPRHRRLAEAAKRHQKPAFFHSCGSIHALIPDLIDVGIDILNPVQPRWRLKWTPSA